MTARPYVVAFPVDDPAAPAFVVFPGGGYEKQADHEGPPVARWLNSLGLAAFVLFYRVQPDPHRLPPPLPLPLPLPLRDAHRALRSLRHEEPQRPLGILGFSAGGHLAACVATGIGADVEGAGDDVDQESSAPALLALGYPVISFMEVAHRRSLENLLGPDPDEHTRRALSAELHVTAATPPTFLWHTAEDAKVDVANSLLFARALAAARVPVELHVFPHGRHGLGLAFEEPAVRRWTVLFESWLQSHGWLDHRSELVE